MKNINKLIGKIPKSKRIFIVILFLLLLFLSIIPIRVMYINNSIVGTWTTDDVTIYQFNRDKTGFLIVPLSKYEFTYKIDGKKLYINFKLEKSTDSDYEFKIKGDKMVLTGINETTGIYNFTRKQVENEKKK